jgi:hypothetical protein
MLDLTVRVLGQEDWPLYRNVRLAAVQGLTERAWDEA